MDSTPHEALRRATPPSLVLISSEDPPRRRATGSSPVRPIASGGAEGRYVVERQIAVGGMAEVLVARLEGAAGFKRRVVVKRALSTDPSSEQYDLFLDEARVAARFNHPNLVQVHDLVVIDGHLSLVMEYLDGADLRAVLKAAAARRVAFSMELAVHVAAEVASGLDYVHGLTDEAGRPLRLIHRDISPPNIFLTNFGAVKIIDFGIAKHIESHSRTQPGHLRGRLGYLAPELLAERLPDARVDVFGLGVVLNEMLTGARCFLEGTLEETMRNILAGRGRLARDLRPDLPSELLDIVERMMATDPAARYPDAASVAAALRRFMLHRGASVSAYEVRELMQQLEGEAVPLTVHTAATRNLVIAPANPGPPAGSPSEVTPLRLPPTDRDHVDITEHAPAPALSGRRRTALLPAAGLMFAVAAVAGGWALRGWTESQPAEPVVAAPVAAEPVVAVPVIAEPVAAALVQTAEVSPPLTSPLSAPPAKEASALVASEAPATPPLRPEPTGVLTVTAEPAVEVWIDGERVGPTPLRRLSVAPGARTVEARNWRLGVYRTLDLEVAVGREERLHLAFATGWVHVQAPEGWLVSSRGRALGTAPIEALELYEGEHPITLLDPVTGAKTHHRIEVRSGLTTKLVTGSATRE